LADASRDFKIAIAAMRIAVRDFTANPSNDLVIAYEQANSLDSIESGLNRRNSDAIATLHNKVLGLKRRSRILCTNRTRSASTNPPVCVATCAKPAMRLSA